MTQAPFEMHFDSKEQADVWLAARNDGEIGDSAYVHLRNAMVDHPPACADDPRFIADAITIEEGQALARICDGCPLRAPCARYADIARPEAGYWPRPE